MSEPTPKSVNMQCSEMLTDRPGGLQVCHHFGCTEMSCSSFITIKRSEVPEYLRLSKLYLSFDGEEADDKISIPSDCMKKDITINDSADLKYLLLTMRFWILEFFPTDIISFMTSPGHSDLVVEALSEFDSAYPGMIEFVTDTTSKSEQACDLAAAIGRVDFLDYFAKKNKPLVFQTLSIASQNGHVECLSYCYDYIRCRGRFVLSEQDWRPIIRIGNLNCLHFLVNNGVPVWKFLALAMQVGSAKCLKYLHENFGCNCWSPATMAAAAKAGKLKLVQGLNELGCPWDASAYIAALRVDASDCLQYLIDQRGVPTSEELRAVSPGKFCHLVLLLEEGKVEQVQDKERMGEKHVSFDLGYYKRRRMG